MYSVNNWARHAQKYALDIFTEGIIGGNELLYFVSILFIPGLQKYNVEHTQ